MAAQIHDSKVFEGVRLPKLVEPEHYDLKLRPNLVNFTFDGNVQIDFVKSGPTEYVTLNVNEVEITDGFLTKQGAEVALKEVHYNKKCETASLKFDGEVPDRGTLNLNFKGTLNDQLKGFYRTAFKIGDETVHAATTQFESTDARRCFPCWDEPNRKATFTVTLTYKDSISVGGKNVKVDALSNMPIDSEHFDPEQGRVRKFLKTPKMSTYLLAFIVGPFEYIEASDGKRPIRVYTTPGKVEQGRFALDVACKAMQFYEDYFGILYPLPKMDLIAIPDFMCGAMENWGLVTYRETCILVDPEHTSTMVKQYVAIVVAHELAHQWFGNLVTMEWWTHLWLNEGFARFMENMCTDHIFKEFDLWSQFVSDAYCTALNLDSLHNSHPIEVPVNHPDEIGEIFDSISYEKGATVIRMLYTYLGDESFRKGMNAYLNKFAYKNAVTEDLWDALEAASGKPVRKLMTCWTSQKGFPWLSVTRTDEAGGAKLKLTQSKFNADGELGDGDHNVTWVIPLAAVCAAKPGEIDLGLFEGKTTEVMVKDVGSGWLKLNPGTIGLYRSAYAPEMIDQLLTAVRDQTLSAADRLGLHSDFFALCQAGHVKTVKLLELLQAYKGERDYIVWKSIDSCVGKLNSLFKGTDFSSSFKTFGIKLYEGIFKELGWTVKPGEKYTDALTRSLVIARLVSLDYEKVLEDSLSKYRAHVKGEQQIPADLRGAIYRAVASHGNDEDFEGLFKIFKTSELQEEQTRVLRCMGFTTEPNRRDRFLNLVLSSDVRNQDKPFALFSFGATDPSAAFQFLKDNKDSIRKFARDSLLQRFVKFCTDNLTTDQDALEVEKFFKENEFSGTERTVKQSIESIRLNSKWLARDQADVRAFFAQ